MTFDCDKIKHKCKAECCGPTPIPKDIFERNRHKLIRPIEQELNVTGMKIGPNGPFDPFEEEELVVPIAKTDSADFTRCAFLTYDLKCNIYEDRPWICRNFGNESHPLMKCSFQAKDGRIRCRQEKRAIERSHIKKGHFLTDRTLANNEGQLIKIEANLK